MCEAATAALAQLCAADCLPHEELHERWAFARRALRRLKGGRVFGLTGWLDHAVAVDVVRAQRLREAGYRAWTAVIDPAITPMNRVLLGCKEAECEASLP